MSKKEVESLPNDTLKKEFEQVVIVMKSGIGADLPYPNGHLLFVHFLNVSQEIDQRKKHLCWPNQE